MRRTNRPLRAIKFSSVENENKINIKHAILMKFQVLFPFFDISKLITGGVQNIGQCMKYNFARLEHFQENFSFIMYFFKMG